MDIKKFQNPNSNLPEKRKKRNVKIPKKQFDIFNTPIMVQANPGNASTYSTFGQYIPRVQSTPMIELGQALGTLAVPLEVAGIASPGVAAFISGMPFLYNDKQKSYRMGGAIEMFKRGRRFRNRRHRSQMPNYRQYKDWGRSVGKNKLIQVSPEVAENYIIYTVQPGDSLYKIAHRNGIDLDNLIQLNMDSLTQGANSLIVPGDQLIVGVADDAYKQLMKSQEQEDRQTLMNRRAKETSGLNLPEYREGDDTSKYQY